jgi:hypothetical protein
MFETEESIDKIYMSEHVNAGVNISFYTQILHLGKVSLFMGFWEEFLYFRIHSIFCCELTIQKGKPFPIDNIL